MLNGRHVLIVEEEFLIALDIRQMLEEAGVADIVIAPTAAEALTLPLDRLSLAIIEMPLGDQSAVALFETLRRAGIATIISTADGTFRHGMPGFAAPVVIKPFAANELTTACRRALGGEHSPPPAA